MTELPIQGGFKRVLSRLECSASPRFTWKGQAGVQGHFTPRFDRSPRRARSRADPGESLMRALAAACSL
jgi:hypothetical protein